MTPVWCPRGASVALTGFLTGRYTPGSRSTKNRNSSFFPRFGDIRAWCVAYVANIVWEACRPSQASQGLFIELLCSCFAQETPSQSPPNQPTHPSLLLEGRVGWLPRQCEGISWAKQELSSSEKRPNIALEGHVPHTRNFELVATHQPHVQPKTGIRRFFLVSVKREPGVWPA